MPCGSSTMHPLPALPHVWRRKEVGAECNCSSRLENWTYPLKRRRSHCTQQLSVGTLEEVEMFQYFEAEPGDRKQSNEIPIWVGKRSDACASSFRGHKAIVVFKYRESLGFQNVFKQTLYLVTILEKWQSVPSQLLPAELWCLRNVHNATRRAPRLWNSRKSLLLSYFFSLRTDPDSDTQIKVALLCRSVFIYRIKYKSEKKLFAICARVLREIILGGRRPIPGPLVSGAFVETCIAYWYGNII